MGKLQKEPQINFKEILIELILISIGAVIVFTIAGAYDALEIIVEYSRDHEEYELDELITVALYLLICLLFFSGRKLHMLNKSEKTLRKLYNSLVMAQTEIKQLQGILPICSSCKKIRDEEGAWQQLESYIHDHSEAQFSHGICSECISKLYPDIDLKLQQNQPKSSINGTS